MSPPPSRPSLFRALRHRNYRHYFIALLVSNVGMWLQIPVLSWYVWSLTDSNAMMGWLNFVGRIPALFATPFAGVLADRYSRQKIVVATQALMMVQALALAWLVLSGHANMPAIFALSSMLGLIGAFDIPARQAFVVEMVGKEDLQNAIALNSFAFNAARIVGPAIAGPILALLVAWDTLSERGISPEGIFFFINGISFGGVIWLMAAMKVAPRVIERGSTGVFEDIGEALTFVRRHAAMRWVLLYMAVMAMFGYSHLILLASVADEVLGRGAEGFGVLLAASGVGAMAGALLIARSRGVGYGGSIPFFGLLAGAGLIAFSFSHTYWLSLVLLLPSGAGMIAQSASTNSLLQNLVPDELRGRVMSFFTWVFLGMFPIGCLIMGQLAERLGPLLTLRIGGAILLVGAAVLFTRLPAIRASVHELTSARM